MKKLPLIILLLIPVCLYAQENNTAPDFPEKYSLQLDLSDLNVALQFDIGNGFVSRIETGPGLYFYKGKINFLPTAMAGLRFYPRLKIRYQKDRNLKNFTGYYISLITIHNLYSEPNGFTCYP
jgi:hypothetical protein